MKTLPNAFEKPTRSQRAAVCLLLAPLLLSVIGATKNALPTGFGWAASQDELLALAGFAGVVISASVLLFDFVWQD